MSYRREDYPEVESVPWLDRPDALQCIDERFNAGEITAEQAEVCRHFHLEGYATLGRVVPTETCEEINTDVQRVFDQWKHLPFQELRFKFQDMYHESPASVRALKHPDLLAWLDLLLGRRMIPFQTLNMPISSQQGAHSDAILMSTQPPNFMSAAWIALEDVQKDAGPVAVVPRSHRLPYISAKDIGIPRGASDEEAGVIYDEKYYDFMSERFQKAGLSPVPYLGKQGEVLIWHSNLVHGAYHCEREGTTRNSLIVHYFAEGVETYSDLWERKLEFPDALARD